MATSDFTAKSVPLLHGCVVVATHDHDGDLDGLSWEQQELLIDEHGAVTAREARRLAKRALREDGRRQRRKDEPARTSPNRTTPVREAEPLAPAA